MSAWKQILSRLKGQDTRRKGVLAPNTFRKVLGRFNIHLSDHMMKHFKSLFPSKKLKQKGISCTAFIKYFTVEYETQLLKKSLICAQAGSMAPSKSAPLLSSNFRNKAKKKKKCPR